MKSDAIVLLSKQAGVTSFSSLGNVKKALLTSKVGHTGTLDSFAEGLLVVCTGRYTKLCGQITAFDKSYEAVIHFGKETDTLEYTGNVVYTADLPTEENLKEALLKWTGKFMQKPPLFSAIHIDGQRASVLARDGKDFEIAARPVEVFNSEILELKKDKDSKRVEYARISFSVSKGTYIRSLARDIALSCGSRAYLTGLYRTKVGKFKVEDSAGFSLLEAFTIENAIRKEQKFSSKKSIAENEKKTGKKELSPNDLYIQNEILQKLQDVDLETAEMCGFQTIFLKKDDNEWVKAFKSGKPLKSVMFEKNLWDFPAGSSIAVFERINESESFTGLINKNPEGRISYGFVLN